MYKSKTLGKKILDNMNSFDKSINKTRDILKLISERNEDLFP